LLILREDLWILFLELLLDSQIDERIRRYAASLRHRLNLFGQLLIEQEELLGRSRQRFSEQKRARFQQTKGRADVFDVRVRNSDLLRALDHKLMFPSGKGSGIPKTSKLANQFPPGDRYNDLGSSFLFKFKAHTFDLWNGVTIPYLKNQPFPHDFHKVLSTSLNKRF
jgi:hypothetical protein